MTFGHVTAPVRLASRRRLAIFIPLGVGLVVGAALWFAGERTRTRTPPPPAVVVEQPACTFIPSPEPPPPPPPEPPKPVPGGDAWSALETCLRQDPFASSSRPPVTVAHVRHWVEVEHDPVWFEKGQWWFPLSGEGDPQMPSGLYVAVPLEASAPCSGAIVN